MPSDVDDAFVLRFFNRVLERDGATFAFFIFEGINGGVEAGSAEESDGVNLKGYDCSSLLSIEEQSDVFVC